jgi:hypothetical protein
MAWTTPKTWALGDVVTHTELNTYVRDNLNWLYDPTASAKIWLSAAQAIPNDTEQTIVWLVGGVDWNDGPMWASGNPSRFTAPVDGYYLVDATVVFEANATGYRYLAVRKNGSTYYNFMRVDCHDTAAEDMAISGSMEIPMSATDYLEMRVKQNSGGSLDAKAGASDFTPLTCMSAHWVSGL